MMQPKFTVIVPVFNAENYIERCIESLFQQTIEELEIIAVNDGSTDKSLEILGRLAEKDSRLVVLSQENSGPSVARNLGISNSSGLYISFVDADDWMENNSYELLFKELEKCEYPDITMFNAYTNDRVKNKAFLNTGYYNKEEIKRLIYPRLIDSLELKNGSTIRASVCLRVFKRECIYDRVKFEPALRNNEDLAFCFLATIKATSFLYLGEMYLYHNCLTKGSTSRGYMSNSFKRMKPLFNILSSISMISKDYNFSNQIKRRIFRTFVFCCENEFLLDNKKSFSEKYKYIKNLINQEEFLTLPIGKHFLEERSKKAYMFFLKYKMVLPIMILANHRVKKRVKSLKYV